MTTERASRWTLDTLTFNGHGGATIRDEGGRIATVYYNIIESRVDDPAGDPRNARTLAAARLMTAAPSLLAALRPLAALAREYDERVYPDDRDTQGVSVPLGVLRQARAAIEEATK